MIDANKGSMQTDTREKDMDRAGTRVRELVLEGGGNGNKPVLIAGKPSRMRDSLHVLLKTMPGIEIVGHADDDSATLRMVAEHQPVLVLLDTNLPGEGFSTVLAGIQENGLPSRCLVLADSLRQHWEAQSAGADASLVKGFSAVKLFEIVERLLPNGKTGEHVSTFGRSN
jgi:DNA-binding NarL/FixJ family response regulator